MEKRLGWPWQSEDGANCRDVLTVKVRDIIKTIEAEGWYLARVTGGHRHFKHRAKSGIVTISGHPNDDVAPKTLDSILKQAGLKGVI